MRPASSVLSVRLRHGRVASPLLPYHIDFAFLTSTLLYTIFTMSNLPRLPPLAALFLTHFHDLKGQEVSYYVSQDGKFTRVNS